MSNLQATLDERGARYGDFTNHAVIAQGLQDTMRSGVSWDRLDPVKRQALTVICDKIARIVTGDPEYRDNWHDIQGYARLAEDRCTDAVTDTPDYADSVAKVIASDDPSVDGVALVEARARAFTKQKRT